MSGLRIAVTGLAATYPYGGVFWDYLQYLLGLRRLGHEVLYIEDTGRWCYDPVASTFVRDGARNAVRLHRWIAALDPALARRWFMRDAGGRTYGVPWPQVASFCRDADLFLHVSGSCWMRDEYFAARRVAYLDSDPMYTQASLPDYLAGTIDETARARVETILAHDAFLSFGENVGRPGCRVPGGDLDWRPTRQPIVLDRFAEASVPVTARRRALTTVGSWEPAWRAELVVDDVGYGSKGTELERFIELPARSPLPLELALSGHLSKRRLRAHGWRLAAPNAVSDSPWAYRRYLARSLGEWSVAKSPYVAGRTGWFSCRSACYLALGVPVVVQDTGFPADIPRDQGVLAFTTLDEAAAAIERLASDPGRHALAAREVARECFDSDRVLSRLLDDALANPVSKAKPQPAGASRGAT